MKYSNEDYINAKKILNSRRIQAEERAEMLESALMEKSAEYRSVSTEIRKTASTVALAVLSGGGDAAESINRIKEKNKELLKRRAEIICECGYNENDLKPNYYCKKCKDTGEVKNQICDCMRSLLKKNAYDSLNRNTPLKLSGFDDFKLSYYDDSEKVNGKTARMRMKEIFDFCREYSDTFDTDSQNLLLMGGTGLGKTHLSLAIAGEAINKGFGVVYGSAQNLFSRIEKEHFGRENGTDTEEAMLNCDLLVLDDFGTEYTTPFISSALYNILNTRILKGLPTIISTNYKIKEIEKNYHERIASRLMGNYEPLNFSGSDIRQKKFNEDR